MSLWEARSPGETPGPEAPTDFALRETAHFDLLSDAPPYTVDPSIHAALARQLQDALAEVASLERLVSKQKRLIISAARTEQKLRERVQAQFCRLEAVERSRKTGRRRKVGLRADKRPPAKVHNDFSTFSGADAPSSTPAFYRPDINAGLSSGPGLCAFAATAERLPTLGLVVFDLDTHTLAYLVDDLARQQMLEPFCRPVFLTNNPDFSPFRRHRFVFEYFHTRCREEPGRQRLEQFLCERAAFVLRKWGITRLVRVGRSRFLEAALPTTSPDDAAAEP